MAFRTGPASRAMIDGLQRCVVFEPCPFVADLSKSGGMTVDFRLLGEKLDRLIAALS